MNAFRVGTFFITCIIAAVCGWLQYQQKRSQQAAEARAEAICAWTFTFHFLSKHGVVRVSEAAVHHLMS